MRNHILRHLATGSFTLKFWLTCLLLTALASCGGSDGGSGNPSPTATPEPEVTLQSLAITPNLAAGLPAGRTQAMVATGTYSDNSSADLSSEVTWASSDTAVVTFTQTQVLSALKPGTATVSASLSGVSANLEVTVSAAVPDSLTIALADSSRSYAAGQTFMLKANAVYSDQSTKDVTGDVAWVSSNTDAVTIDAGEAEALSAASVNINATLGSLSSNTLAVTVTAATLDKIVVTAKDTGALPIGVKRTLVATAYWSDSTTTNITDTATWVSSDTDVAEFSTTKGLLIAKATGDVSLTAQQGGVASTAYSLTVTDASLLNVALSPNYAQAGVTVGQVLQFVAYGTYTDNVVRDITDSVTWASDDSDILAASTTSEGVFHALTTGSATITATKTQGNFIASQEVAVGDAELMQIQIEPWSKQTSVAERTVQFAAFGFYSDNQRRSLAGQVTWKTANSEVAVVSNDTATRGLLTFVGTGSTTLYAVDQVSKMQSLAVEIEVIEATLNRIVIEPAGSGITLADGRSRQLSAIGHFVLDGETSTQDLTQRVTWRSASDAVATVTNSAEAKGKVTAVAAGSSAITVFDPITAVSNADPFTVTVTEAELDSISVAPATAEIPRGRSQKFTATANYSDGHSEDVTSTVLWASSSEVATIRSTAPNIGEATGFSVGSTVITATDGETDVVGTAALTVTPAELLAVTVAPETLTFDLNAANVSAQKLTANGDFTGVSDDRDISESVLWSTSTSGIVAVSNTGLVEPLSKGTVTVTATDSATGFSDSASVTVNDTAPEFATVAAYDAEFSSDPDALADQRVYINGFIVPAGGNWYLVDFDNNNQMIQSPAILLQWSASNVPESVPVRVLCYARVGGAVEVIKIVEL